VQDVDLGHLVHMLQTAVVNAQASIKRRQRTLLHRLLKVGPDGEVHNKTLKVRLPSGISGRDEYEPVELPLLSLIDRRPASIAELSLEFNCELREIPEADRPDESRLVMTFHAVDLFERNRHRVKITLYGPEASCTDIRRDGLLIRQLGPGDES